MAKLEKNIPIGIGRYRAVSPGVVSVWGNPERIGCIDRAILKAWVFTPEKLDLSDLRYLHVLKCAECTRELIELRQLRNEQSARANWSSWSFKLGDELAIGSIRVSRSFRFSSRWGDLLADPF
jgi:hypothetical protein